MPDVGLDLFDAARILAPEVARRFEDAVFGRAHSPALAVQWKSCLRDKICDELIAGHARVVTLDGRRLDALWGDPRVRFDFCSGEISIDGGVWRGVRVFLGLPEPSAAEQPARRRRKPGPAAGKTD